MMEHFIVGRFYRRVSFFFKNTINLNTLDQWLTNKQIHFMVNSGFSHNEVVKVIVYQFLSTIYFLAHKVTEVNQSSQQVNVSFSDPEHHACKNNLFD